MSDLIPSKEELTPQQYLAEMNRRMLAGEDITNEELADAINTLRADRSRATQGKAKKVAAKQETQAAKAAVQIEGEDILNNLI